MKTLKKIVILSSFMLLNLYANAQSSKEILNDINTYWPAAKLLLDQTKVNPIVINIMDRMLPKIASQNIKGSVDELANVLYEKTSIKYLNPEFRTIMENKCYETLQMIKQKNYAILALSIAGIGIEIDNFITSKTKESQNSKPLTTEERAERTTIGLTKRLNLTSEQSPKIKAIFLASIQQEQIDRQVANGDKDEFRRLSKIRDNLRKDEIKNVLTEEQWNKFDSPPPSK